jgi:hypothetical protein
MVFYGLIKGGTQAVDHISTMLDKPDGWSVALCMGRINCHMLCIVGVFLGNGGAFILGLGDFVVKEQTITFA